MNEALIPMYEIFMPIAIGAFFVSLLACLIGIFYSEYQDNWPQFLGMGAIALASVLKIVQIYGRDRVTFETTLLAVGIALFACGVAWKVWQRQRPHRPRPPKVRHHAGRHHPG